MVLHLLEINEVLESQIDFGEKHHYKIIAEPQSFLQIDLKQKGIDLQIDLCDQNNNKVFSVNGLAYRYLTRRLYWIVNEECYLVLTVYTQDKESLGGLYDISIRQLRKANDKDIEYLTMQEDFRNAVNLYNEPTATSKTEAIEVFLRLLGLSKKYEDKDREYELLILISNIYNFLGYYQKSVSYLKEALVLADGLVDINKRSLCLNNIGVVYDYFGDKQALTYYTEALEMRQQSKDLHGVIASLINIGVYHFNLGYFQKALSYYQEARLFINDYNNPYLKMSLLGNIAVACNALGQTEQALSHYNEVLALQTDCSILDKQSITYRNMGDLCKSLKSYDKALEYYNKALDISNFTNNLIEKAHTLNQVGLLYELENRKEEAVEIYKDTLEIADKVQDICLKIDLMNNIGLYYQDLSDFDTASEYISEALLLSKKVNSPIRIQIVTRNMGFLYQQIGFYKEALSCYEESLNLAIKLSDKNEQNKLLDDIEYLRRVHSL